LTGTRESLRDTETEIKRKVKHEKEIEKEKYRKKSKGERKKHLDRSTRNQQMMMNAFIITLGKIMQ